MSVGLPSSANHYVCKVFLIEAFLFGHCSFVRQRFSYAGPRLWILKETLQGRIPPQFLGKTQRPRRALRAPSTLPAMASFPLVSRLPHENAMVSWPSDVGYIAIFHGDITSGIDIYIYTYMGSGHPTIKLGLNW